jgi:hypothetical protein
MIPDIDLLTSGKEALLLEEDPIITQFQKNIDSLKKEVIMEANKNTEELNKIEQSDKKTSYDRNDLLLKYSNDDAETKKENDKNVMDNDLLNTLKSIDDYDIKKEKDIAKKRKASLDSFLTPDDKKNMETLQNKSKKTLSDFLKESKDIESKNGEKNAFEDIYNKIQENLKSQKNISSSLYEIKQAREIKEETKKEGIFKNTIIDNYNPEEALKEKRINRKKDDKNKLKINENMRKEIKMMEENRKK